MSSRGTTDADATVRGRAVVVPQSTGNIGGEAIDGNVNNLSARSRARSTTLLIGRDADDGAPVSPTPTRITCQLPNWLRMVMHDAGSNAGQSERLPRELVVPVVYDQDTRTIVDLDVARTEELLAEFFEIGRQEWKETEAVLAPLRNVAKLPGAIAREVPALLRGWRNAAADLRQDLNPAAPLRDEPPSERELAQHRAAARSLGAQLAANPRQLEHLRAATLPQAPAMAAGVAAGTYPRHDFAIWVMRNELSGVFTAAEAAELRAAAGLPADP